MEYAVQDKLSKYEVCFCLKDLFLLSSRYHNSKRGSCEILNIKDIYVIVALAGDMTEEYAGKDIRRN